jgi:hypothetical protein
MATSVNITISDSAKQCVDTLVNATTMVTSLIPSLIAENEQLKNDIKDVTSQLNTAFTNLSDVENTLKKSTKLNAYLMQVIKDLHCYSKPFDIHAHDKFVSLLANVLAYDSGAELPDWKLEDYVSSFAPVVRNDSPVIAPTISTATTPIAPPVSTPITPPVTTPPVVIKSPSLNPSSLPFAPSIHPMMSTNINAHVIPTTATTTASIDQDFDINDILSLISNAMDNKIDSSKLGSSAVPAILPPTLSTISVNIPASHNVQSSSSSNTVVENAPSVQPVNMISVPPVQSFRSRTATAQTVTVAQQPPAAITRNTDI